MDTPDIEENGRVAKGGQPKVESIFAWVAKYF